jgi:rod shape-determining protein MreC
LVVLLLLVLPFVFYASNSKATRNHNRVDRIIVWLSAPVQLLVTASLDGADRLLRRYVLLINVEQDNERLRAENARLRLAADNREEQRLENLRLCGLLALKEQAPEATMIAARVIAVSPTPLFRSFRVDRGRKDGVKLGAPVINAEGAVGRVAALNDGYADVMLLVDANSSTDVLVQRTRARGRLHGSGGDRQVSIEVQYLARTDDIDPGDILITSGAGGIFPKGVRVGVVTEIERRAFGLYQKARAKPAVDFERIEEVLILQPTWPHETDFERAGAKAER